jgi:LacI family transcriptional regulator
VKSRPTQRITMAAVAARAGVSQMTVSRSFRNDPSIPDATRKRIKEIAKKLGYTPDPAISQLMARLRSSRVSSAEPVAWITTHPTPEGWRSNPASVAFFDGASARARQLGYRLEEFWLDAPNMNARRLSGILRARGIRGVLVAPLYESGHPLELDWNQFAAATCGGYSLRSPQMHRACSHHFHAMKIAWDTLTELGYHRIGLALSSDLDHRVGGLWLASLLLEQRRASPDRRVPPLVTDRWNSEVLMRWFRRHKPDVIISFKTAYDWLLAGGVRVPDECGFALLDIEHPKFAGVDEQRRDVGAAAFDIIVEQFISNQVGTPEKPKIVLTECAWVNGPTAPPKHPRRGRRRRQAGVVP